MRPPDLEAEFGRLGASLLANIAAIVCNQSPADKVDHHTLFESQCRESIRPLGAASTTLLFSYIGATRQLRADLVSRWSAQPSCTDVSAPVHTLGDYARREAAVRIVAEPSLVCSTRQLITVRQESRRGAWLAAMRPGKYGEPATGTELATFAGEFSEGMSDEDYAQWARSRREANV